jgi:hypothetical protein
MLLPILLLLISRPLPAQPPSVIGPFQDSSNFAYDLGGVMDTRPSTYGMTETQTTVMQFNPPEGYRVRVLKIEGDLIFAPEFAGANKSIVGPVPPGTGGYIILAFNRTSSADSHRCTPCDDNSIVTLQGKYPSKDGRLAFDRDVHINGVLEDGQLVFKVATFFNTTGRKIHAEPSVNITYQFEYVR